MFRQLNKGYLDASFVILIWSGFILVSRLGGKSPLLTYDVVALRFGTAALLLLPVWIWRNKVNLLDPKILALGLTGGIGYSVMAYLGFKTSPAAHGAILLPGMLPFLMTILSWLILHERPSRRRIAGLAVIALGVACLGAETFTTGFATWGGDLAFIGGSVMWGLYSVLIRKWRIGVWDSVIGSALATALMYLPVYILLLPKHIMDTPLSMIAIQAFYQGVMAVIVAMVFYMRALTALGPSRLGLCMALVPAISGVAAIPLLGEPLSVFVVLGLLCASAGAWLGNRGQAGA